MKKIIQIGFLVTIVAIIGCHGKQKDNRKVVTKEFPAEIVDFSAYKNNPVSAEQIPGHGTIISENAVILFVNETFKMWYSGYHGGATDP
jgi:hypothetical protein